jgi:hypothetical protein
MFKKCLTLVKHYDIINVSKERKVNNMTDTTIELLRETFDCLIDNSNTDEEYLTLLGVRDIVEYALADNQEYLKRVLDTRQYY